MSCPDDLAGGADEVLAVAAALVLAGFTFPVVAEPATVEEHPAHRAATSSAAASNR
ncbi:MAG: hypothetical protein ABJD68_04440 [Nakamurella sp.]